MNKITHESKNEKNQIKMKSSNKNNDLIDFTKQSKTYLFSRMCSLHFNE